ncbi:YdcF family protein [Lachnospiraceae bacterium 46-15]
MELLCLVMGVICLGYYVLTIVVGMDFSFIWLAGGIVLLGGGVWMKFAKIRGLHLPGMVKAAGIVLAAAGLLFFLVLEGLIVSKMGAKGAQDLDYVIVLGAQVRGDVPSKALMRRIQKAEEYLKENPETIAVLSGGKGNGENISEAQAMYDCLVDAGIEKERLIKEDKSTSTVENLEFSAALIGKSGRIGIISQNFHIYRALKLAEHQGYEDVYGIASSSELIYQPHFMVREAFAIVKEKLTGNI